MSATLRTVQVLTAAAVAIVTVLLASDVHPDILATALEAMAAEVRRRP